MNTTGTTKLALRRQSIRALTADELQIAHGGKRTTTQTSSTTGTCTTTGRTTTGQTVTSTDLTRTRTVA